MRRLLRWVVVLALVGAAVVVAVLRVPALQDALVARVIAHLVGQTADALFVDDALRVAICGSAA